MGEADACDENRVTSFPPKKREQEKNLARFGDSKVFRFRECPPVRSAGEIKKHSLLPPCP